jgi:hypothetical protein
MIDFQCMCFFFSLNFILFFTGKTQCIFIFGKRILQKRIIFLYNIDYIIAKIEKSSQFF